MDHDPDTVAHENADARSLERIVEAARQLNTVTTRLTPPPWTPFAQG
jgi:hypothetical protein